MKLKILPLVVISAVSFLYSCKNDSLPPLITKDINTVYWDIPAFPASLPADEVVLTGEVGNHKDVDSLHVVVTNLDDNSILYDGTINKSDLTPDSKKDYAASDVKWYKINYKPTVNLPSESTIQFTLVARTPFGSGEDLRSVTSTSVLIEGDQP